MADEEDVTAECRLQHNWHVACVEKTDGIRATHAALAGRLDGDLDAEALKVDHRCEDDEGRKKVHDVGKILAVESFPKSALLVGPREQQVEKGNDCAFKLGASSSIDGGGREGFPDDRLADVCSDEERDSRALDYRQQRQGSSDF